MKKFLCLSLISILLFCTSFANNYETIEDHSVNIIINSQNIKLDSSPVFSNSALLFPLRELANILSIKEEDIIWDNKTSSVLLISDKKTLVLKINSKNALLNNIPFELPSSPILYKNQTYVPIRLFSEFFNYYIIWDALTRSVFIKEINDYFKTSELISEVNKNIAGTKFTQIDIITESKIENNFSFGTSIYLDIEKNKIYEKNIFDKAWKPSSQSLSANQNLFSEQFSKLLPCAISINSSLTDENYIVLSGFYPTGNSLLCSGKLYIDVKTLKPVKLISETKNTKKSTMYSFSKNEIIFS